MSNHNDVHTPNRKRTREERKKLMVRIVALIMAFLMVAGAAYYAIYLMTLPISAADAVPENQVIDASSLTDSGDVPVRVGLMHGSNITVGFEVTSENGFTVGLTEPTGECRYTPLWDLPYTRVSAVTDGNLSKSHMTYSVTWEPSNAVIGGYHIQVDCDRYDRSQFTALFQQAEMDLAAYNLDVIPAYVYTGYTMRIGAFSTKASAEAWLDTVAALFPEETVYVTGASDTSVAIVQPDSNAILFEFDCGGQAELGMKARENKDGNTYMKTPAGNVYDGVFMFSRCNNGTIDGVALTNIVSLEAYIAGVLPFEITNTWPVEALKSFAVTVRSFTLTHRGRHEDSGFDLCSNVHCQVYKGAGRINAAVMEAVAGTAGLVMTYNGEILSSYYSSSVGGTTVSAKDAWGGEVPYLQAIATPWENYMEHENAFWIVEVTPDALGEQLRQAGYDVHGAVKDVRIGALAANSTYVKVLEVTDSSGRITRIAGTDAVRTAMPSQIKSSNFVVGKGSVEYAETTAVYPPAENGSTSEPQVPVNGTQSDGSAGGLGLQECYVMTVDGKHVSEVDETLTLMTANGKKTYERQDLRVLSGINKETFAGENAVQKEDPTETNTDTHKTETLDKSTDTVRYKMAYADNPNNFIFVGKGWGHGVGISQYGTYDLAVLGYTYDEILNIYFKNIALVPYRSTAAYRK